ncbi:hypothetical protein QBC32DRAFT_71955 [Pseudoneurospora amorphoporcata]|uniref:Uncharacterized protein n=1 Tax=Pseudoneurospora amorphoporcata TaxID=241081 RepID=A0AAN6NPP9_9PEZI|nr:hypothetical protein QBC32DRAFT_71955 [Pseudoneurospora amorphoporcata]
MTGSGAIAFMVTMIVLAALVFRAASRLQSVVATSMSLHQNSNCAADAFIKVRKHTDRAQHQKKNKKISFKDPPLPAQQDLHPLKFNSLPKTHRAVISTTAADAP